MDDRRTNYAWAFLPVLILGPYFTHTRIGVAFAGVVAIVAGLVVALDVGGAADTVPAQLARTLWDWSPSRAQKRRVFACVALWGVVMLVRSVL